MAEVNDKGEVTVEGEFVGKLEGFRFRQDASGSPDEARTLSQAALAALKPEFHLRADRFYNAPDTEMDFTTQGGLMWGSSAVGKLVKGQEQLRPSVEPFVDDEAGPEVIEKVRRRLQHFIDRKVAAQFEPLAAISRDETLTGLARGFAFRLVENLGVIPRDSVAGEVKELDQEARAALRKHGVRFGQFTIFMPALLKPAPTRLRLVLWSLWQGLADFPEAPPPGLVTIPNLAEVPRGHYTLSGYHPSGARAIRIDMLERLADIVRTKDSRVGFEATPDMLSITGMTLDQFVDLMAGLGYQGEKGERPKAKVADPVPAPVALEEPVSLNPVPEEVSLLVPPPEPEPATAPEEDAPGEPVAEAAPEVEVFYTFTWAPKPRARPPRPERPARPQGDGQGRRDHRKPRGDAAAPAAPVEGQPAEPVAATDRPPRPERGPRPEGGGKGYKGQGGDRGGNKPNRRDDRKDGGKDGAKPRAFEARPPRVEKPIDPDNPFAVLAALKSKI